MSANESMEFKDTELTLGLPGTTSDYNHPRVFGGFNFKISSSNSSSMKRGFMDTVDQISLQKSSAASEPRGSSSSSSGSTTTTSVIKAPAAKARIVGWPPVRSMRQKALVVVRSIRKYVKVRADGAPYLRKQDLEMYKSYQELLRALERMFPSLTISGKCIEDSNEVMKPAVKGMDQYVLTYEDKDGDWMLVGDVPWKQDVSGIMQAYSVDEKFRCCWDSSEGSDSFLTMNTNSTAHHVHINGRRIVCPVISGALPCPPVLCGYG